MGGVTDTRATDNQAIPARVRRAATAGWAALLIVWVVWGSTYVAIRVGVEAIPPLLLTALRNLTAGLILYPLAARGGDAGTRVADRPGAGGWIACAITGVLLLAGGNGGLSLGERTVDAGLASLLVASVPLWLLTIDGVLNRARIRPAARPGAAAPAWR
jgi:drug/metabolite transporter (DMT)-like permease